MLPPTGRPGAGRSTGSGNERLEKSKAAFEQLAGGTDAGQVANVYLGEIAARGGDTETARRLWTEYLSKNSGTALAVSVELNLIALDRQAGKLEEVKTRLEKQLEEGAQRTLPEDVVLNELATMDLGEEQFEAKFKVMKENVEHHIEEEETQMFPKGPSIPNYQELGMKMAQRKQELLKQLRDIDDSERATTSGKPATMKASGKSEAVMAGEPLPATRKQPSRRRSGRAKATSGRKKAA